MTADRDADLAVAAGQRLDQPAVLVAQRAGQAVDLGLGGERDGGVVGELEETSDAADELFDFRVRERVVEAHHRLGMRDLREMRRRGGADRYARRIGTDQVREGCLDRDVTAGQRVIDGVGNLRRVLRVI